MSVVSRFCPGGPGEAARNYSCGFGGVLVKAFGVIGPFGSSGCSVGEFRAAPEGLSGFR